MYENFCMLNSIIISYPKLSSLYYSPTFSWHRNRRSVVIPEHQNLWVEWFRAMPKKPIRIIQLHWHSPESVKLPILRWNLSNFSFRFPFIPHLFQLKYYNSICATQSLRADLHRAKRPACTKIQYVVTCYSWLKEKLVAEWGLHKSWRKNKRRWRSLLMNNENSS